MSVDGLGNPLRFILTGGQQHDITQAESLIAGYAGEHVLADQGYDAQEFRQHILELGMMPVIPPRSNRNPDYDRHRTRLCFINKIKADIWTPDTGTAALIWWNASSTRSSTIAGYSPASGERADRQTPEQEKLDTSFTHNLQGKLGFTPAYEPNLSPAALTPGHLGRSDQRDYARYHEVLNRARPARQRARCSSTWNGPLIFGIDETLERRRGAKIRSFTPGGSLMWRRNITVTNLGDISQRSRC